MYIAAGQGQITPGDKILMSTEPSFHFGHMLQTYKKISLKSDCIHFFLISYVYTAPKQGLTIPWGRNLMSTGTACHLGHLLQV